MAEAGHLEAVARTWRARDYRYGGGCCHAAMLDHLSWGRGLLGAQASDRVTIRLRVAVADLHYLAGWICFDTGQVADAHTHFQHALTLARHSHHDALLANIYYRIGRVHLHHHTPAEALTQFQRGRAAAQACASQHAAAILCANQAWAYANHRHPGDRAGHHVDLNSARRPDAPTQNTRPTNAATTPTPGTCPT